ncbi:hypothetical protein BC939DRAFT_435610 [Gamsiella multidivaricata]|uniref:uncharacterized protein n=1 Tax=Gamsiella multidivaricata TaxID=101098 RepID=UPI0022202A6F|nr:uncharacterized protein BC939DRAFT_435610 [Gamsiella multidivaricata]KAI7832484.1 hypothetical protein BC939DRAFT_435610 [Gamsiella multidivaricata]
MMGQYLLLSRQTPSSALRTSAPPRVAPSLLRPRTLSSSAPGTRKTVEDFIFKAKETMRGGSTDQLCSEPLSSVVTPPADVMGSRRGLARSTSVGDAELIRSNGVNDLDFLIPQATKPNLDHRIHITMRERCIVYRRLSSTASSSTSRSTSGSTPSLKSRPRFALRNGTGTSRSWQRSDRPSPSASYKHSDDMGRIQEMSYPLDTHHAISDDDIPQSLDGITGYDRAFKTLAEVKRHSSVTRLKINATFPRTSRAHSQSNIEDYYDSSEDGTMGTVSLEKLTYSCPHARYDSIHQATIPEDNRNVLLTLMQQTMQSNDMPAVARLLASTSRQGCSYNGLIVRPGLRRPSTVQYTGSASPLSSMTHRCHRFSRRKRLGSPYFGLIPEEGKLVRPESNVYSDEDMDYFYNHLSVVCDGKGKPTHHGASVSPQYIRKRLTSRKRSRDSGRSNDFRIRAQYSTILYDVAVAALLEGENLVDFASTFRCDPAKPDSPLVPCFERRAASVPARGTTASSFPLGNTLYSGCGSPLAMGMRDNEGMVYSTPLNRMIALPKGSRPTRTQSSKLPRSRSKAHTKVPAIYVSSRERLLAMGPLPPAPADLPPAPVALSPTSPVDSVAQR